MNKEKKIAVGIDLGTTYSCVAVFLHGKVEIIPNDQGNRVTPSYVAFTDAERLVGDPAQAQVANNPQNTIYDIKRVIGRKFNDKAIQHDLKVWPFTVINDQGKPKIEVVFKHEKRIFTPEEISSMILSKMKETAETFLGQPVRDAVVTVPAYFNDSQRQATKDACTIAGLHVLRMINEPTAAALAYGLDNKEREKNILVFDLGGGTFDVSVLTIDRGIFEVLSTSGNTHLGGQDFDGRMVDHFVGEFFRKHGLDLKTNKKSMRRLQTACERAKKTLSSTTQAQIEIDSLFEGIDFSSTISRTRFEELNSDYFKSVITAVENVLHDAGIPKSNIEEIVLVGGSTRIPKIQKMLQNYFDGKQLNCSINPDEAVAYGAAIQAAVLMGDASKTMKDILLIDVTPLSTGIEIAGGMMSILIPRNTSIPCSHTQIFSTYTDNQHAVSIQIYEGERGMTKDNHHLGMFRLTGLPAAPRGILQIEVTFEIDENGILSVTAQEKTTGQHSHIIINKDKGRLSKSEIDKMIADAERFKDEDEKNRQKILARNSFESYCLDLLRSVNHLPEKEGKKVEKEASSGLLWLEEHDKASKREIEERRASIERTCFPIIEQMYRPPRSRSRKKSSDSGSSKSKKSSSSMIVERIT